jgi:hypothetical protein
MDVFAVHRRLHVCRTVKRINTEQREQAYLPPSNAKHVNADIISIILWDGVFGTLHDVC